MEKSASEGPTSICYRGLAINRDREPRTENRKPSAVASTLLVFLFIAATNPSAAQEPEFDLGAYEAFLEANADMPAGDLLALHPAGIFQSRAGGAFYTAFYADSVRAKYGLTPYEEDLASRHGFVVTERLTFDSFGSAFMDVYAKDLPVFISTDAILHAIHMSYDSILKDAETAVLAPKLEALLAELHAATSALSDTYAGVPGMQQPLRDLDVYLTVPRTLLTGTTVPPVFSENAADVQEILGLIAAQNGLVSYPLFTETCRLLDFSQFTPRGHYTQSEELTRYFQAMIWFGRTEIYLSAPATDQCSPSDADVQRQAILAMLVTEATEARQVEPLLAEIEELLQLFVGESDNVTLPHLQELRELTGLNQAAELLDTERFKNFQETLIEQAWSMQRIQSQILVNSTPLQPGRLQPASAFLLFGQRFVIDSYVTSSVVYDRIEYEGTAVLRMLPDPLDVLFALGNDAAAQLLEPELNRFSYASNLAALRYLIESYEGDFWQHTLYNGWLNSIRTLNPPAETDRANLPAFMQTAAWWQEKMNTQLAAWAQLRHDNLLYAKQSYTGVPGCEYPFSYVEPIPTFYEAVSTFARTAAARFGAIQGGIGLEVDGIANYFGMLAGVNDTLAVIAQKELDGTSFDDDERSFLRRVLYHRDRVCYEGIDGWYARLFYGDEEEGARKPDQVVADIHTAPADESGAIVGWVLHVGTGPINMAVVTAELPGEGRIAFAGPVMSYYQHLSTGFERLTDEVWQTSYAVAPSFRPEFVNLYLADASGQSRGDALKLAVGLEDAPDILSEAVLVHPRNYPNPFSEATNITFSIPSTNAYRHIELAIYDARGRLVEQLVDEPLPAGHYSVRWEGMLATGNRAASGVYFCRLRIGDQQATTPMAYVR